MMDSLPIEDLTLWQKTGNDAYGNPLYATAVALEGRWTDGIAEFIDVQNQRMVSSAVIDLDPALNGVIPKPGDQVYRGLVYTLSVAFRADPRNGKNVWPIKHVDQSSNILDGNGWATAYV